MLLFSKKEKIVDVSEILIGFGVLFIGLSFMSGAITPYRDAPIFSEAFRVLGRNPILGMLAGLAVTALIQSSSASVGILQTLAANGLVNWSSAVFITLGQNIGTCVTAMLSAVGANRSAKRTAFVHLYFNIIGATVFMVLYFSLNALIGFSFSEDVVGVAGIALIHSIFNIFTTLILLPFTKGLEKLAYLTIPESEEEREAKEDIEFQILDDRFLQTPAFAIEQCRSLADKMAELSKDCFLKAMQVLFAYTDAGAEEVIALENKIDVYEDKLSVYLTKLNSTNLAYNDSQNVSTLLHCIMDFERISDHAVNVVESAQEMNRKEQHFSKKAEEEMQIYGNAIEDILTRTMEAFVSQDKKKILTIEPLEEVIDKINKDVKKRHIKRLRKGKCTIELGLILSDVATNYERVSDHCSNIAVCLIQMQDSELEAHSYMNHLKDGEDLSFEKQVEVFAEKYNLGKEKPSK